MLSHHDRDASLDLFFLSFPPLLFSSRQKVRVENALSICKVRKSHEPAVFFLLEKNEIQRISSLIRKDAEMMMEIPLPSLDLDLGCK